MKTKTTYYILETASYKVKAESGKAALEKFLGPNGIKVGSGSDIETTVHDREVIDGRGNAVEVDDE